MLDEAEMKANKIRFDTTLEEAIVRMINMDLLNKQFLFCISFNE
jgi:hypothetical protein